MELFFYFFQNLQYLSHLIYNYFCFTIIKYETILENKRTKMSFTNTTKRSFNIEYDFFCVLLWFNSYKHLFDY